MNSTRDDEKQEAVVTARTHRDLPLLTEQEFDRQFNTQFDTGYNAASSDAAPENDALRILVFRGYVEREDGSVEYHEDGVATGLRGGITIGIEGKLPVWAMDDDGLQRYENEEWTLKGPEDWIGYELFMRVPSATQKAYGIVCDDNSCRPVWQFAMDGMFDDSFSNIDLRRSAAEVDVYQAVDQAMEKMRQSCNAGKNKAEELQSREGYVAFKLPFNSREHLHTWDAAVKILHQAAEYIQEGEDLGTIHEFVYKESLRLKTAPECRAAENAFDNDCW